MRTKFIVSSCNVATPLTLGQRETFRLSVSADRYDDGRWLDACFGRPDSGWLRGHGFAFAVSQVSSQH